MRDSDEEGVACESSDDSEPSEGGDDCEAGEACEGGGDVELLPGVKLDDGTMKKKKRKKKKRKIDRETKELLRRQEVRSVCRRTCSGWVSGVVKSR